MGKSHRECGVRECEKEARFTLMIRVWPEFASILDETQSMRIQLDVVFCLEHARIAGQEDILSDAEWQNVCEGMVELGEHVPDRKTARIEIEALDNLYEYDQRN